MAAFDRERRVGAGRKNGWKGKEKDMRKRMAGAALALTVSLSFVGGR